MTKFTLPYCFKKNTTVLTVVRLNFQMLFFNLNTVGSFHITNGPSIQQRNLQPL